MPRLDTVRTDAAARWLVLCRSTDLGQLRLDKLNGVISLLSVLQPLNRWQHNLAEQFRAAFTQNVHATQPHHCSNACLVQLLCGVQSAVLQADDCDSGPGGCILSLDDLANSRKSGHSLISCVGTRLPASTFRTPDKAVNQPISQLELHIARRCRAVAQAEREAFARSPVRFFLLQQLLDITQTFVHSGLDARVANRHRGSLQGKMCVPTRLCHPGLCGLLCRIVALDTLWHGVCFLCGVTARGTARSFKEEVVDVAGPGEGQVDAWIRAAHLIDLIKQEGRARGDHDVCGSIGHVQHLLDGGDVLPLLLDLLPARASDHALLDGFLHHRHQLRPLPQRELSSVDVALDAHQNHPRSAEPKRLFERLDGLRNERLEPRLPAQRGQLASRVDFSQLALRLQLWLWRWLWLYKQRPR